MLYRVETGLHANITDTQGRKTALHLLKALQIPVAAIRQIKVYTVDGLDAAQVNRLVDEGIWHDPILQQASLEPLPFVEPAPHWIVEVGYRPGVTDNEGRTARDTAAMVLGIARDSLRVYTSVQYRITCTPDRMLGREEVEALARDLLCNTLIQRFRVKSAEEWQAQPGFEFQVAKVTGESNDTGDVGPLSSMDDEALQKASRDNTWALTLRELHCIRDQFATPDEQARRKAAGLPADPTDVEMEVLAQTWSEHCKHKIFASRIHYENKETGQREEVNNLYKTCIRDATAAIRKRLGDDDYCKSVFKDNAGVIAFINGYDACIKVETHNSPSALDPYGGALTGIVGVNRDPMGTGMGAELVCNTDVFCFASPFYDKELITLAAEESGFAEHLFEKNDRNITNSLLYSLSMYGNTMGLYDMPLNDKLFIAQSKTIQNVAEKGPCVIVGLCADYVLRNNPNVLNVFIHSDMESKVRRVVEDYGVESDNVVELINKTDKRRANYYNYYTGMKWGRAENYHLALRTDCIGIDGAVETLIRFIEAKNAEMEKEAAEAK